jgi:hypothetical protein
LLTAFWSNKITTKPTLMAASAMLKTGLKNSKSSPAQKGQEAGMVVCMSGK